MNPIIVTDSTADIPDELVERLGITVVPLKVMFGDEALLDGFDIKAPEFYRRLVASNKLPTTSQPSPVEFTAAYQKILDENPGAPIVSIHISTGMSGTFQSATLGHSMLEQEADITLIDSRSASYGFGLMVVRAAEMARAGSTSREIEAEVERLKSARKLYFLVDTLEYLQKGGRIGKAAAVLGALLNIKPILSIDKEGVIYAVEKARGRKKALARVVELFKQDLGAAGRVDVAVGHTADPASADEILALLRQHFDVGEVVYSHIGSVVGTHVGPGCNAIYIWPSAK
ncbi:DegV family protein [Saccharibacillus sp. CPCC 101409]|uniref:DegV family protein n=1 Tax=Saccharibacillus sp. CPCC 101409 TaxID=3058041 RepID=UPI002670F374|nr:DegV family protein [Saccharibacillus sp. CPCC 101409]MDO3409387.1 DegV family protein [Saccharibacillus sp. CPCC 101409]